MSNPETGLHFSLKSAKSLRNDTLVAGLVVPTLCANHLLRSATNLSPFLSNMDIDSDRDASGMSENVPLSKCKFPTGQEQRAKSRGWGGKKSTTMHAMTAADEKHRLRYLFCIFVHFVVPMGFFPMGNSGSFPQEKQAATVALTNPN